VLEAVFVLLEFFISFEKNFYRLPFTPPLSGSPYRSFNMAPDGVGRKDYSGEVLGEEAIHVLHYVENS
jgi:hypothetical protein